MASSTRTHMPIEVDSSADLARKLAATKAVLADREAELLKLKGPCRWKDCRLHHAHSGPCDTKGRIGGTAE